MCLLAFTIAFHATQHVFATYASTNIRLNYPVARTHTHMEHIYRYRYILALMYAAGIQFNLTVDLLDE